MQENKIFQVFGANTPVDVPPLLQSGRTFVPLRFIGEALGSSFSWDGATQTVTFTMGDQMLTLVIGQTGAGLDAAPFIENGRTMVPVRYISEAFGASVNWDGTTRQVTVTK